MFLENYFISEALQHNRRSEWNISDRGKKWQIEIGTLDGLDSWRQGVLEKFETESHMKKFIDNGNES